MNKRGMGSFTVVFLIMVLCMLLIVEQGVDVGQSPENMKVLVTNVIENASININNIEWNFENEIFNNSLAPYISVSLNYMMDMFRISVGLAMDLHEAFPQYINPRVLIYLITAYLLSSLIVPIFTIMIIIFLFIKEFFDNRKEKKSKGGQNDVSKQTRTRS